MLLPSGADGAAEMYKEIRDVRYFLLSHKWCASLKKGAVC